MIVNLRINVIAKFRDYRLTSLLFMIHKNRMKNKINGYERRNNFW